MPAKRNLPSPTALFSAAASAAATAVLIRSVAGNILPRQLQVYLWTKLSSFFSSRSSQIVIAVHEFEGLYPNQLFKAAEIYLAAKISPTALRFRASIPFKEDRVVLAVDKNQVIVDVFAGVEFSWKKVSDETESTMRYGGECEERGKISILYFELSFDKKHRDMVINSYFPHIQSESSRLKREYKSLKIHMLSTYSGNQWIPASLNHPATFNTLAMEPEMKKMIMDDLDMFVRRKEFYTRVGKAWKRGYLLYGPPGTGKSSLIAAIANYLKFDIYDLELADLNYNSELRNLLTATANRSILVVEDIDCSVDLDNRKTRGKPALGSMAMGMGHPPRKSQKAAKMQVTLSGLLNFIDGLWSSCGDERIIIFTTNHKERLDPALLRPGRMDLHIHMSYCTPCGFRMLASNYLGVAEHPLFAELEGLVATAKATPAEVGEQLMRSQDPEAALKGLLEFLRMKEESDDAKDDDAKEDKPEKEPEVGEIGEESEEDGFDF